MKPDAAPGLTGKESRLELPSMPKTMALFHRIHESVLDSYQGAHCGVIATKLAKCMIKEKHKPRVMMVYEELEEPAAIEEKKYFFSPRKTSVTAFVPLVYAGKMEPWHAHSVCCLGDVVYDPILEAPVPLKEYTRLVFGKDIAMKVQMTPEETERSVV